MPRNKYTITKGMRFGRLRVVGQIERSRWECCCDCGKVTFVNIYNVINGRTSSCGCLRDETHPRLTNEKGFSSLPEYKIWSGMLNRCFNPNNSGYSNYGLKGITVCKEWKESFLAFYAHVGPRPSSKHSLDRINNSQGYKPGNVRWTDDYTQARNTSRSLWLVLNGERLHVNEWAARLDINASTLWVRIRRYGWSDERTLTTPKIKGCPKFCRRK